LGRITGWTITTARVSRHHRITVIVRETSITGIR
jgi:hypothetical protein